MQCATKSIILHLQWAEEEEKRPEVTSPTAVDYPSPISAKLDVTSPPVKGRPSLMSPLNRSTSSVSVARRKTLSMSTTSSARAAAPRPSLPTPTTPMSPFAVSRSGSPRTPLFAVRYGQAAVLTAPPRLIAVVETPDVALGSVDAQKRRVVTTTRFSTRAGADRSVSFEFILVMRLTYPLQSVIYLDASGREVDSSRLG